ncbi:DHA2 family efflux MFS transporter permease subunit [Sphingomonas zeae]|jgi:DHA2 family multidrug resistance protein
MADGAKLGGGQGDASAWLAVMAGTIGALMATLDISIVNAALPTIQGEVGASGSEGTWIATAYLVAEIVAIPLTGWLERLFGLRLLLVIANIAFVGFSVLGGISTTLPMLIAARVGQGFFGGMLIPTAMTIIATRLPPDKQPIGTAMFGATAVLGPVAGPLLGGWLTETYTWHYAFFINLPIGVLSLALLTIGLPASKKRFDLLRQADWLGIAGLAMGLGGLTVVLEDGQRELWFESPMIRSLAGVSAVGFVLLFLGQLLSEKPVIKLALLLDRSFAAVFLGALAVGAILFGISYLIPQYLSSVAGYNAFQAGQIVLINGVPMLLLMPLLPLLIKTVDVRIAVGAGMLIMGAGCFVDTNLNPDSAGEAFYIGQITRGFGQMLALLFLNQAAVSSVSADDASDASGLFNAARNLGGSFALAMVTIMQEKRTFLHERRLEETLSRTSERVQDYIRAGTAGRSDMADAMTRTLRVLSQQITQQATVMTYNDLFFIFAVLTCVLAPVCLLLRPLDTSKPMAAH